MTGDAPCWNRDISSDHGMGNVCFAQSPQKLDKARAEIDNLVGNNRLVNESDLSKFPYLQNIISETFRLFPAAAPLLEHELQAHGYERHSAASKCLGHTQRPHSFGMILQAYPERFEAGEVGPTKLLPFGIGRRSCPGNGLANRVVGLTLASLIQCFEWQRTDDAFVDMTEGKGISRPKTPLEARCKARNVLEKALTQPA
ncbi:UNVERIFIED_CONTAM: cytochrome [Sesamum calycinum]|uniref:Cytochrome n=1 Tax=Sesamum calycinum TaxID=2727403 RepID=A0AAW2MLU1_9LAMI